MDPIAQRPLALLTSLALALVLGACGGGGSSGGGGGGGTCATCPTVAVTGTVSYQNVSHNAATHGLDYAAIVTLPVRGATVEARSGSGSSACSSGALLDTDTSDAAGNYALTVPQTVAQRVCVRAEVLLVDTGAGSPSWNVQVRDNTSSDALYILQSAAQTPTAAPIVLNLTATTGWGGSSYTGTRAAAPFAILDAVYTAIQKVLTVAPITDFDALDVFWSVSNTNASGSLANGRIGTTFYQNDKIYVLGDADNDTDEFDDHVIIHEYGHYLEDNLSRSDSIGGSHSGGDRLDFRVAYGEGFGNAWSGIVTDDPVYEDSFGNDQLSGFDINVETDAVGATQDGWFSEVSVQAVIYDLYDATNEGGGDGITLGLANIWPVWIGAQRTTPAMTSAFSFLDGVRDANPGSLALINALATANDINGTDEYGLGEANSGGLGTLALPPYTTYVVGSGSIVICSSNGEGEYNALGNRRFLRIDIAAAGNRTFSVTSPSAVDPDAVLFLAGTEVRRSQVNGNESFLQSLAPGTYILEVYPYTNVDDDAGTGGANVCLTVSVI